MCTDVFCLALLHMPSLLCSMPQGSDPSMDCITFALLLDGFYWCHHWRPGGNRERSGWSSSSSLFWHHICLARVTSLPVYSASRCPLLQGSGSHWALGTWLHLPSAPRGKGFLLLLISGYLSIPSSVPLTLPTLL